MNATLKSYLSFSKKESIAAIALTVIIIPFAILPFLKSGSEETVKEDKINWISIAEDLEQKSAVKYSDANRSDKNHYRSNYSSNNSVSNARLFSFDPNAASADELMQLGLREKTIQILSNYRNKGGKFRKADDLQKIYGLRPDEFDRLKPFIVIKPSAEAHADFRTQNENRFNTTVPHKDYKRKVVVLDVNVADTTAFQSLYGIGSKLAARIVNFRNKLGGFYSIDQVGETYGVPDSTFQKIKPYLKVDDAGTHKMNINTATYEELNAHPYISSKLAYLIMKHRKDAGNFTSLDLLKDLVGQTNDSFERVVNYLSI